MRYVRAGNCPSRSRVLVAVGLLLCCLPFSSPSPADVVRVDVTGTWDMIVDSQDGTSHPSITLKQDGERISGTYEGKIGTHNLTGSIKGNDIDFVVNLKFRDVSYDATYRGAVDNDSMKGTARFGQTGSGTWSARKRKNPV